MIRRLPIVAFTALLLGFTASSPIAAQSLSVADLPGYKKVREVSTAISSIKIPRVDGLKWDEAGETLLYSVGGKRMQLDLASGMIGEVKKEANKDDDANKGRRGGRGAGVGRARQRLWIQSSNDKLKAVYRNHNIVLESLDDKGKAVGEATPVTTDGTAKHRYGTACWVYGEELYQQDAMWFSPDSTKLAFYEIDESHMKTYFLTTRNSELYTDLHKEQYPTAGQHNPHVKLHIYDVETKKTITVKTEGPVDQYLYKVRFSPAGDDLIFHRTNRWQNKLDVMAANVDTGETRSIVTESQETWQKNNPVMQFLEDGKRFVWETERTGWKQYELRSVDGKKICDLTPDADYPAHNIVKVDEENGWIYYSAYSHENRLNLQLHRSRLDGTQNAQLTNGAFNHSGFQISPNNEWFKANYETVNTPPASGVWNMDGKQVATLSQADPKNVAASNAVTGELFSFTSSDGKETIYGTLFKPRDFDPAKKYPLLIDVYGGPSSVGVTNRFQATNPYCELGFVIAKIGNRGTMNRGKAFESATYLQLGILDMDDQADGVKFLAKREYIDGDRVGVYGHSYGGYMSALALLRYPDVFHVGVAGAPVTDWKNYDTIYTERYMRTPQENKEGYKIGSCVKLAKNLKGKLFVLHGLVDDNVHPSNTWQLVDALQKAGKRFDMMVYPNNAHGFGYTALRWEYFIRHLKPEVAPSSK